jgi:hypothetical protein
MTDDPLVTIAHLREAKLCSRGARQWCARYNIDFMRFITTGIPCSEVEAINDQLGLTLVKIARDEANEVQHGRQ